MNFRSQHSGKLYVCVNKHSGLTGPDSGPFLYKFLSNPIPQLLDYCGIYGGNYPNLIYINIALNILQGHPGKEGPNGEKGHMVSSICPVGFKVQTDLRCCISADDFSPVGARCSFVCLLFQGPAGPQGPIGYPGPRGVKVGDLLITTISALE